MNIHKMKNSKLGAALCVVALVLFSGFGPLKAQSPQVQNEACGQRDYDPNDYVMNSAFDVSTSTLTVETFLKGKEKTITVSEPLDVIILLDAGKNGGKSYALKNCTGTYGNNGFKTTGSSSYSDISNLYGYNANSGTGVIATNSQNFKYLGTDGVFYTVNGYTDGSKYYLYFIRNEKWCFLQTDHVVEVPNFNGSGTPAGVTGYGAKEAIWKQSLFKDYNNTQVDARYYVTETIAAKLICDLKNDADSKNVQHRVCLVKYGNNSFYSSNHTQVGNHFTNSANGYFTYNKCEVIKNFLDVSSNAETLMNAIYSIRAGGDHSDYSKGFEVAKDLFGSTTNKKVIVLIGSGVTRDLSTTSNDANFFQDLKSALTNIGGLGTCEIYSVYIPYYKIDNNQYMGWASDAMKALSSDYPNASVNTSNKTITLGTQISSPHYYMEYTNISNLANIYAGATQTTMDAAFTMDASTIVKGTLGDDVEVAGNVDVKKAPFTGMSGSTYTFGSEESAELSATITGQTVEVTGFNFSHTNNWVGKNNQGNNQGYKLIVKIPVRVKTNHYGMNLPVLNSTGSTILVNGSTNIGQNFGGDCTISSTGDWLSYVLAKTGSESGISISGTTATISSNEGLAWFAAHANGYKGTSYANYNVELTADIDMAGKTWVPIGGSGGYSGTFNGNGHVVSNMSNDVSRSTYVGLFGTVSGGTVKNVAVKDCNFTSANAGYSGIIADELTNGGTVSGCVVSGSLTGTGYLGGVVGNVANGTVSSCISMVAPTGGGSLVYEGAVSNCYATVSGDLVKSGTMTCCYNRATRTFYNEGGSSTFEAPAFGYGKKGCESGDIRLIDKMTAGKWAQPVTTSINGGYPVLKLDGLNTMAEHDNFLYYGNINTLSLTGNILFYGKESNVTKTYSGDNLYIDEDAALKLASGVTVNAHTSRFIKNLPSKETEVWHHYSSPVSGQSLGITYGEAGEIAWENSCKPQLYQEGGFLPYKEVIDENYGIGWDLYCFHEPAYHWINFKRNSSSHWYSENHTANIVYPNEETLTQGKGYLVALGESSYVQATGILNHGSFTVPVKVSDLSATPGAKLQGVNLLGNPYQSYLSFQAFADGNSGLWNGTATYLTYDPEGDYYTQGSTAIASRGSQASSGYLSMHQGFFIVSDKPVGNYTATFTDAMCSVNPEGDVHFRGEKYAYPLINLMVRDSEGVGDLAVVEFDRPEFAAAPKLFNYGGKGKVYFSYENEDDALLFLSEAIDQLPVHFDALEDAEYTLNWSTANADFSYLHLIDNITGADIDMLARNSYSFSATTADYKSRFKMKFAYTGIGENEGTELVEVFAFLHDGNLIVNGQGTIDIIDMNGRTICNQKLTGEQNTVGLPNVAPGIYVVRLINNSETKVQKIIVNK